MKHRVSLLLKSLRLVFKVSPWQFGFLISGILVQGIMPAITIWLSADVITKISEANVHSEKELIILCLMWAASLFLLNLIEPWIICWQSNLSDKAVNKVNIELINKSNAIEGLNYFENPNFYNDIQILQSQSGNKPINLIVTAVGLSRDFVMIISGLFLLYTVVPWISIVVLVGAYLNFKTFSYLQNKTWQESLGRSLESRRMTYISSVSVGSQYAKEIRFFDLGYSLFKLYGEIFQKIYKRMSNIRVKQAFMPILPFTVTILGNLLAFYVVVKSAITGHLSIGAVALFLQTLAQMQINVANFGEQAGWLSGHMLYFEKFFSFLDLNVNVFNNNRKIKINKNDQISIEFKNVFFSYSDSRIILKNINFSLKDKEKVAIVGLNGAGKSTIIKLLCGFYAPTSGKILINGISLCDLDLKDWRSKISPVFQDFNSYSFSLKENIIMGEEYNKEKFDSAILQSGVKSLLYRLPNGIEEQLGKDFGGTELSRGQSQRIAIARALYKDSSFLVLDEPTASLDPINEYELFEKFVSMSESKTVIFVTHRLSSVIISDRVLVMHDGEIIGNGSHDGLMKNNVLYHEMFTKQSKNYVHM